MPIAKLSPDLNHYSVIIYTILMLFQSVHFDIFIVTIPVDFCLLEGQDINACLKEKL